jgi:hypothetical protein
MQQPLLSLIKADAKRGPQAISACLLFQRLVSYCQVTDRIRRQRLELAM